MTEIRMNYQEMRAVATDVRTQAEQARGVIETLQRAVSRLLPTWAGASKQAFEGTYTMCHKELERVPQMLDQISIALAQTAERIEEAEAQAVATMHSTVVADDAQ